MYIDFCYNMVMTEIPHQHESREKENSKNDETQIVAIERPPLHSAGTEKHLPENLQSISQAIDMLEYLPTETQERVMDKMRLRCGVIAMPGFGI